MQHGKKYVAPKLTRMPVLVRGACCGARRKRSGFQALRARAIKKELETKLHYCGCILLERWKSSGITKGRLWTEAVGVRWSRDQSAAHAAKVRDRPVGCLPSRPASCTALDLSPQWPLIISRRAAWLLPRIYTNYIKNMYTRNPTDLREKYRAALKFITQFGAPGPDVYAFKVLRASNLHHRANSVFGANLYKLCCFCRPEWTDDCGYLDARGAAACWFETGVCLMMYNCLRSMRCFNMQRNCICIKKCDKESPLAKLSTCRCTFLNV